MTFTTHHSDCILPCSHYFTVVITNFTIFLNSTNMLWCFEGMEKYFVVLNIGSCSLITSVKIFILFTFCTKKFRQLRPKCSSNSFPNLKNTRRNFWTPSITSSDPDGAAYGSIHEHHNDGFKGQRHFKSMTDFLYDFITLFSLSFSPPNRTGKIRENLILKSKFNVDDDDPVPTQCRSCFFIVFNCN